MWLAVHTSADVVFGCMYLVVHACMRACVCSHAVIVCMHSGPRGTTRNAAMACKAHPMTNAKMETAVLPSRCMQFYPAGDSVTQSSPPLTDFGQLLAPPQGNVGHYIYI